MNDNINKEVITLPPFKKFCMTIGQLPGSYLASMTYYEAVTWLSNYLEKTVIPILNNNAEAVTELQTLFTELQNYVNNYFDNLDIQEEINNKLDEMAESGQLTDIIAQYLGLAGLLCYNTIADMKAAENLVNGSFVMTFGRTTYNDGNGHKYKIREITNQDTVDDYNIIALSDESLIAELIQDNYSLSTFNTVADMVACQTLKNGMACKTLGYYAINDGGGATYKITNEESETEHQEELENGLYANLIIEDYLNIKQIGAISDDHTDNLDIIQKAINLSNNIFIPEGTYMIDVKGGDTSAGNQTSGLIIGSNKNIKLDENAYIKTLTNDYYYYRVLNIKDASNVRISGGHIYGDKLTHTGSVESEYGTVISIQDGENILIENCELAYGFGDSLTVSAKNLGLSDYSKNINIKNCILHDSRRQGISIISCHQIIVSDCEIYNINGIAPQSGIDIEANYPDSNPVKNVIIENCYIHDTTNNSIIITSKSENVKILNCLLDSIYDVSGVNTLIDNCTLGSIDSSTTANCIICNSVLNLITTYNGGKIKANNCIINDRIITSNNSEEIIINNSKLNFISTGHTAALLMKSTDSLTLNNCEINFDNELSATPAKNIIVTNCTINPSIASAYCFRAYNCIFKNNIINNYNLRYLVSMTDGDSPSYVDNNIFKINPTKVYSGSSNQYLFLTNNISPSSLTNNTFDHLIEKNNYNNSTV